MKRISIAVGLSLLIAPVVTACGAGPRGAVDPSTIVTPLTFSPPPIYALLGYRSDLQLTSDQVAGLDSIAQAVEEGNRPLVREFRAGNRERSRQPGVFDITPENQALVDQIRENQKRASDAVESLLTADQQATVCRLFERSARTSGQGQGRPGGRPAGDGAAPRDPEGGSPRAWTWCATTGEPSQS